MILLKSAQIRHFFGATSKVAAFGWLVKRKNDKKMGGSCEPPDFGLCCDFAANDLQSQLRSFFQSVKILANNLGNIGNDGFFAFDLATSF